MASSVDMSRKRTKSPSCEVRKKRKVESSQEKVPCDVCDETLESKASKNSHFQDHHAKSGQSAGEAERNKALIYADKLEQYPIGLSVEGKEMNALVSRNVHDALPNEPFLGMIKKSIADAEDKLSLKKNPCVTCNLPSVPAIADIIKNTPFAEVLGSRCYKMLSKKRCEWLNLNWTRHPEARLVASHMLAGAILYNIQTGEAIFVNEVETYGRGRIHDCHREQTGFAKDNIPMPTSMPSTTGKDYYKDVHPVTYDSMQDVGGETLNFEILESEVHDNCILLDSEQVKTAKKMIGKPVSEITKNKRVECMRQIKS
ncbi:hypothetical protein BGX34_009441, partial [Mortierella sp. NVP85]